jgi:hypothetical protein
MAILTPLVVSLFLLFSTVPAYAADPLLTKQAKAKLTASDGARCCPVRYLRRALNGRYTGVHRGVASIV